MFRLGEGIKQIMLPLSFVVVVLGAVIIFGLLGTDLTDADRAAQPSGETLKEFAVDTPLPEIVVANAAGEKLNLRDLSNNTLLTFWNSVCRECEGELKDFAAFAVGNKAVNFVIVNIGDDINSAEAALKSYGTSFGTYYDVELKAFNELKPTMPSSFFIRNGRVRYYFPGRISTEHLNALLTPTP